MFEEYLALPDGAGRFPQGVSDLAVLRILLCNTFNSCTGLSPSMAHISIWFHFKNIVNIVVLQPQPNKLDWFGLFPFRSPLLRKSFNYFLFLGVLRCFSSPRSHIIADIIPLHGIGLPHSEISGSKCMCHSPKLIAAYHVLHRLSNPRHPPYALSNFQKF